jgi:hypothetical protein
VQLLPTRRQEVLKKGVASFSPLRLSLYFSVSKAWPAVRVVPAIMVASSLAM